MSKVLNQSDTMPIFKLIITSNGSRMALDLLDISWIRTEKFSRQDLLKSIHVKCVSLLFETMI